MNKNSTLDFSGIDSELPEGWFSDFDMTCIYPVLVDSKKGDVYLEVGVDRGRSLAFARKFFKGDVFGIDTENVGGSLVEGANFIHGNSDKVEWTLPIKVLFIDGGHQYKQVKKDWEKYSPHVDGWVFFHDADETSPGVKQLAEEVGATFSDNPRCSMAWVEHRK